MRARDAENWLEIRQFARCHVRDYNAKEVIRLTKKEHTRQNRAATVPLIALLLLAIFSAGAIATPKITKGPYIIFPGNDTEMMVLWQVNETTTCAFDWGLDPTCASGSLLTEERSPTHEHSVTLVDLIPGEHYYYSVTIMEEIHTGDFFAAPPKDAASLKFMVYGDTRTYIRHHNEVCGAMLATLAEDPEYQTLLVHSGDWVTAGATETCWKVEYFSRGASNAVALQASLPIQGCTGNHELYTDPPPKLGSDTLYRKYWPYPYVDERYWSFDYGPAHFVVLDQYTNYSRFGELDQLQLAWLKDDLGANSKDWTFIILHEPGYSAAVGNANVRLHLQPLCEEYGVDIVFAGHYHCYARAVKNSVLHITTGGGGAPLGTLMPGPPSLVVSARSLHFCKIEIDGPTLTLTVVTPDGNVLDGYTIEHNG
jgi:predicted phosphodiesterase